MEAAVRAYYLPVGWAAALGPCHYAFQQAEAAKFQQAEAAKALDIELLTIAYGADDYYDRDYPASPWYGAGAVALLEAMATDEFHFYNEPKTADPAPIFEVIATQLATGSRLVPTLQN